MCRRIYALLSIGWLLATSVKASPRETSPSPGSAQPEQSLDHRKHGAQRENKAVATDPDSDFTSTPEDLYAAALYPGKVRLLGLSGVAHPASGVSGTLTPQLAKVLEKTAVDNKTSSVTTIPPSSISDTSRASHAQTSVKNLAISTTPPSSNRPSTSTATQTPRSQDSTTNQAITALSHHPVIAGHTLTPGGAGIVISDTSYSMAAAASLSSHSSATTLPKVAPVATLRIGAPSSSQSTTTTSRKIAPVATLRVGGPSKSSSLAALQPTTIMGNRSTSTVSKALITTPAISPPQIGSTALGSSIASTESPSTGQYALTVGSNGVIGEHSISSTAAPLGTPAPPTGTSHRASASSAVIYSSGNLTAGSNGTQYNYTDITPFLGGASQGPRTKGIWCLWLVVGWLGIRYAL